MEDAIIAKILAMPHVYDITCEGRFCDEGANGALRRIAGGDGYERVVGAAIAVLQWDAGARVVVFLESDFAAKEKADFLDFGRACYLWEVDAEYRRKKRITGVKATALRTLSWIAREGDQRVARALVPLLHQSSIEVKEEALRAVRKLALYQAELIDAMILFIQEFEGGLKTLALEALERLVEKGDRHFIEELLDHEKWHARSGLLKTLVKKAQQGNQQFIDAALTFLVGRCGFLTKCQALHAMRQIAEEDGDDIFVGTVVHHLNVERASSQEAESNEWCSVRAQLAIVSEAGFREVSALCLQRLSSM